MRLLLVVCFSLVGFIQEPGHSPEKSTPQKYSAPQSALMPAFPPAVKRAKGIHQQTPGLSGDLALLRGIHHRNHDIAPLLDV